MRRVQPLEQSLSWRDASVAAGLVLATLAAYARVRNAAFLTWDDASYVVSNPVVRQGLTWHGILWAFASVHASNWHPLTWISHMLDVSLFGLVPGTPHVENVLIHGATAALLYGLLVRMTGSRPPSAFVAALFALHPVHVESVAWIAERKDVLAALFWVLATGAWVGQRRRPSRGGRMLVLALFVAGLLSKPSLVAWPFTLLIWDIWPFGAVDDARRGRRSLRARLSEAAPLFAIAAAAAFVTFFAQRATGAMASTEEVSWTLRASNAVVSLVRYLGLIVAPIRLSPFYPLPASWSWWIVGACALVLAAVSWCAVHERARRPWLLTGWLVFLVSLAPVLGLIQVGWQAMADRYLTIPALGIDLMAAWTLEELAASGARAVRVGARSAALAAVAVCAVLTFHQTRYWMDSVALFQRATDVAPQSALAQNNYGVALALERRDAQAAERFSRAVEIAPDYAEAHVNLGNMMARRGDLPRALAQYGIAVRLRPESEEIRRKWDWARENARKSNGAP